MTESSSKEFPWEPENADVIMPEQRATAVYINRWGQAVIRQEKSWDEDADSFVIVDHDKLPPLIHSLTMIADKPVDRVAPQDVFGDNAPADASPKAE